VKQLLRTPVLINAVLFQITWFACVLGSAKGWFWPALLSCAILGLYQLQPKLRHPTDLKLVGISILLGLIIDSIWVQSGLLVFTDTRPSADFAPAWIILLWVAFALTINHSMGWLARHSALPIILGAIGGPLSYLAGLKLGAVEYNGDKTATTLYLAIAWAVSLWILVKTSQTET